MINRLNFDTIKRARSAYLIGIGGVGMSALARLLKHSGLHVTGSDLKESRATHQLADDGIPVHIGQKKSYIDSKTDLVVYSTAIADGHLEFETAKNFGKPTYHRAEILSTIVNQAPTSIAVTGTHGKTTTSSMVSFVLFDQGKDPTCLIGGEPVDFGTNAIMGKSGIVVSEVDESDQTHELFYPSYAIITNLEDDHVDHYSQSSLLNESFSRFLSHLNNPGLVVYSDDDHRLRELVMRSNCPKLSFGLTPSADFSAQNIHLGIEGASFDLFECGIFLTRAKLNLLGLHNVSNALACIALLTQLGLDPEQITESLSKFHGAKRRLEIKYQSPQLSIINDYAHNPTKVAASVNALRIFHKRLTVIFQPHRYSRTQRFFREFAQALRNADELILLDIYGAGEKNPTQITTESIYQELLHLGHPCVSLSSRENLLSVLTNRAKAEGVIAFLGAGDIGEMANEFASRFKTLVAA